MERIKMLRAAALQPCICKDAFFYYFYKRYTLSEKESVPLKYADSLYYAFSNLEPVISEGELIVGKVNSPMTDEQSKEWNEKYRKTADEIMRHTAMGQDSHMAVDYDLLLASGINGIIEKIDEYLNTCSGDKADFYESCKISLQAVAAYSENYADAALRLSETADDEQRKQELISIAEICRKVPANPAESFYEAVQSVHFLTHCLSLLPFRFAMQQFQLGRPDRYLFKYYENDINSGKITKEYAQLLLDCLGIQINMRVPSGLSSGYMVGGRDSKGNIVANDLTMMCMQTVDNIKLVYPAVGLCWTEGMEDKYLEKACEILSHGCSHPAVFNDDVISKGLMYYGMPEKEAHDYIHSTCVEITPVASSNVWVASPYTNMAQLLLDCLDREYDSLDELIKTMFDRLDRSIKGNFDVQNETRRVRDEYSVNPLLSCFVNDCLECGTDIEKGGARYNWIMPSFVGMANLVDSLYAIKKLVFDNREMTVAELKKAVDCNFEGYEELRYRILNTIPKYGNDIDDVDKYFEIVSKHIVNECKKHTPIHQNGRLIPSVFCWVMHSHFGAATSATPDGRLAGFPLGDGSGPCQGREMNGPTASIISSTKWPHHEFIGGVAVNMKFSKRTFNNDSFKTMISLIKSFLIRGGFEMQINVVDKETLEKARKTPDMYKDLVVRIGGYSDYFVRLSPQMQEEVILRTEHEI